MGKIGYGYGSEWHLLRYLGYHRDYLSNKVLSLTGGQSLTWLDFRFLGPNKSRKIDGEHIGFNFLDDDQAQKTWRSFWPQSGNSQNWDAVGIISYNDHQEWLLVEAKAHLNELKSSCKATNQNSINKINTALTKTISRFCDPPVPVEHWLTPYYQYANRLAALYFLIKECNPPIPARLLSMYFCGDQRPDAVCPQTPEKWGPAIEEMDAWLGINQNSELSQRVHQLFIEVNPRSQ
jgi:hypothetical protein